MKTQERRRNLKTPSQFQTHIKQILSSNEIRQDVQHTTECVANTELLTGPFRQVSSQMANLTAFSCQTKGKI